MNKKLLFCAFLLMLGSLRASTCPTAADELKTKAGALKADVDVLKKKGELLQERANKIKADGETLSKIQAGLQERIKGIQESIQTFQLARDRYQEFVAVVRKFNSSQESFENFLARVTKR